MEQAGHNRRLAIERGEKTYEGLPCTKAGHTLRSIHGGKCIPCQRKNPNGSRLRPTQEERNRINQIRLEALAAGESHYQGAPCPHGHDGLRYTSGGSCVGCQRDKNWVYGKLRDEPWHRNRHKKALLGEARRRALKKGREFAITEDDIEIHEICPCCLKPMEGASLDRVENAIGYVPGNVEVICKKCNRQKGDASIEELETILAFMKRHQSLATPSLSLVV